MVAVVLFCLIVCVRCKWLLNGMTTKSFIKPTLDRKFEQIVILRCTVQVPVGPQRRDRPRAVGRRRRAAAGARAPVSAARRGRALLPRTQRDRVSIHSGRNNIEIYLDRETPYSMSR